MASEQKKTIGFWVVVAFVIVLLVLVIVLMVKVFSPDAFAPKPAPLLPRSLTAAAAASSNKRKRDKPVHKKFQDVAGAITIPSGTSFSITTVNQICTTSPQKMLHATLSGTPVLVLANVCPSYGAWQTTNGTLSAPFVFQTVIPMPLAFSGGTALTGVFIPTQINSGYVQGNVFGTGINNMSAFSLDSKVITDGFFGSVARSVIYNGTAVKSTLEIMDACFPSGKSYNFLSPCFAQSLMPGNVSRSNVLSRAPPTPGSSYIPIGFVIDGTGAFIESINVTTRSGGAQQYVVTQSVPAGEATQFFLLVPASLGTSELDSFIFFITPSISIGNNSHTITITPPATSTPVTIGLDGSFEIPTENCIYVTGGLLSGNAFLPRPVSMVTAPISPAYFSIGALGSSNGILTRSDKPSTQFKFTGMNRPGFEWSPMGWFHINQYSSSAPSFDPLERQIKTITSSSSMPGGYSGWSGKAIRIPMNQQFYLSNTGLSYASGAYAGYYPYMIKEAVYAARRGGAELIILDLHWSDCGMTNPLHVQSGNGLCGNFNGNVNGVYGNVGQQMLPDMNSVAFWTQVCNDFSLEDFPDVMFELYNEPFPYQNPHDVNGNLPYSNAANVITIWDAWLKGATIATPTLVNSSATSFSSTSVVSCAAAPSKTPNPIIPNSYASATYVGMQALYNVVAVASNQTSIQNSVTYSRVCIVGGPQFSYRLDGVLGSKWIAQSGTNPFTSAYQYAIKSVVDTKTPAPNILYNSHPYTSQLSNLPIPPAPLGTLDLSEFYYAFGQMSNFSDFVCTEFGNNQGALVGSPYGACSAGWQYQIQSYIDGQTVGSAPPLNTAHLPSYAAWAWYAGDCSFPSMIGLSQNMNVNYIPEYDVCAYEMGQPCVTSSGSPLVPLGLTCMGDPTFQSMKWRAAGAAAAYPPQASSTQCSQSGCCTMQSEPQFYSQPHSRSAF